MGRANIIDILYTKNRSSTEFSFDGLMARPLLSLISPEDIYKLNQIATSIKLSSKPKVKYQKIDEILIPRGFKKLASGTNRIAYKYLEDQTIILKVAIDKVGMSDNPREYQNQFLLKPFVTKVFEVSPCGTVGLFERVVPVTSRLEYMSIAEDVFNMIITQIVGKYVVDDIGSQYFQNIGIRPGMGVVLLDFPYVYELDGNKLYCNKKNIITNLPCGGEIDYDSGFNKLVCTKCGKRYYAHQLKKLEKEKQILTKGKGNRHMKIVIKKGKETVRVIGEEKSSDTLPVVNKSNLKISIIKNRFNEKIDNQSTNNIPNGNINTSVGDYKNNIPKKVFATNEDYEDEIILIRNKLDLEEYLAKYNEYIPESNKGLARNILSEKSIVMFDKDHQLSPINYTGQKGTVGDPVGASVEDVNEIDIESESDNVSSEDEEISQNY